MFITIEIIKNKMSELEDRKHELTSNEYLEECNKLKQIMLVLNKY